jgi:hypothetical protein
MQKAESPSEMQVSQVALMTPQQTHAAATTERRPCRCNPTILLDVWEHSIVFGKLAKWSNMPTALRRGIRGHELFSS